MNRKHNPMVSLAALLLLAVILALTTTGCTLEDPAPMEPQETAETLPRLTYERQKTEWGSAYIITDNETGVQYLFCTSGYGGGITPLLPGEE